MLIAMSRDELVVLLEFLNESEEHLSGIEEKILKLEISKDVEFINSIFRPIHTIKGTSSFLGLSNIGHLSHEVETLLDDIRKGRITDIDSEIIDVLLEAVDGISKMLKNTQQAAAAADRSRERNEIEIEDIEFDSTLQKVRRLRARKTGAGEAAAPEPVAGQPAAAVSAPAIDYASIRYPQEMKDDYDLECGEHLATIEEILLRLESDPARLEVYNDLFRSLHSIKGNTGVILSVIDDESVRRQHYLNRLKDVAHAAESLVQRHRDESVPLTAAETETLLNALDVMKRLLLDFHANQASDVDVSLLMAELSALGKEPGEAVAAIKEIGGDSLAQAVSNSISQTLEAIAAGIDELAHEDKRARALKKLQRAYRNMAKIGEKIGHSELIGKAVECERIADFLSGGKDENEGLMVDDLRQQLAFFRRHADRRREEAPDRRKATVPPPLAGDRGLAGAEARAGDKVIKVAQEKVDVFMNLIGELLISKNNLNSLAKDIAMRLDVPDVATRVKVSADVIARITDQLQAGIMQIRMLPLANAFSRFPRLVRDLSKKLGKKIRLEISGEETEIDKNIIEAIGDPLVHLIRNACDHGIERPEERVAQGKPEEGTVRLKAFNQGQYVGIQIADDGKGIDPGRIRLKALEKGVVPEADLERMDDTSALNLIFLPGFSLAREVTDVSGRGVGMDVVKTNIEKLGGNVVIESAVNAGSTITIRLPLTLAIGRGLEVETNRQRFYLPLEYIIETTKVEKDRLFSYKGRMMTVIRDEMLPVFRLRDRLSLGGNGGPQGAMQPLVILNVKNQKLGLLVDQVYNESEYVIKPLADMVSGIDVVSGAMITGEGRVHLILDPLRLF